MRRTPLPLPRPRPRLTSRAPCSERCKPRPRPTSKRWSETTLDRKSSGTPSPSPRGSLSAKSLPTPSPFSPRSRLSFNVSSSSTSRTSCPCTLVSSPREFRRVLPSPLLPEVVSTTCLRPPRAPSLVEVFFSSPCCSTPSKPSVNCPDRCRVDPSCTPKPTRSSTDLVLSVWPRLLPIVSRSLLVPIG
jgi:hypothetical protein